MTKISDTTDCPVCGDQAQRELDTDTNEMNWTAITADTTPKPKSLRTLLAKSSGWKRSVSRWTRAALSAGRAWCGSAGLPVVVISVRRTVNSMDKATEDASLFMTYGIEKDEEGNEALYINATVRDNIVELDWVRAEDDAESYGQRCLARVKAIANADTSSLAPESACLMMRLYRRGDVMISDMACADGYREQAIRLAKEAALGIYDEVYPDIAAAAQAFVQENIENVKRLGAADFRPFLKTNDENRMAADQFLPRLLELAKTDLEKSGEVVQRIGWLVNNVMAVFLARPLLKNTDFLGLWLRWHGGLTPRRWCVWRTATP